MTSVTKFLNLLKKSQLAGFVAPNFCSDSMTALKKKKSGIRHIVVVEVIRHLVARCNTKEAANETVNLFGCCQNRTRKHNALSHLTVFLKINLKKTKKSKSVGILQIGFRTAFISLELTSVLSLLTFLVLDAFYFSSLCCSQQQLSVTLVLQSEIHWVHIFFSDNLVSF